MCHASETVACGQVWRSPISGHPARFTLDRRRDSRLQLACLALIVAALDWCGGPRGEFARRGRRGPEGLRAAGGAQARNLSPKGPARHPARTAPCTNQRNLAR